jgi:transposase
MPPAGGHRYLRRSCCGHKLLQMLYSVRREQLLTEEIDYSILYRWFVGLNLGEAVWDATTFTKSRDRLLVAAAAKEFLA